MAAAGEDDRAGDPRDRVGGVAGRIREALGVRKPAGRARAAGGLLGDVDGGECDRVRDDERDALAADVRAILAASVPPDVRASTRTAIAVAGTPTSLASIDLDLECYSADKVHGHVLTLEACHAMLERLAALSDDERRRVRGLHPDRAPTIVAGTIVLIEALRLFDLHATEVSDQDILHGAALEMVHRAREEGAAATG
jgi:exopolyphosphatase/pppGpp-phosphohydrolase